MPIKIPNQLPATSVLTSENIFVMTETRAITQDIRPLQILLLNLMPTKIETETQLARVLGNTPIQIELELIAHHPFQGAVHHVQLRRADHPGTAGEGQVDPGVLRLHCGGRSP